MSNEERISALEDLVKSLEERIEMLEKKKTSASKNNTPKKVVEPLTIEDLLEKFPSSPVCTHYFSSGQNKGKFCGADAKVINGISIKEFINDNTLEKDIYHTAKCTKHSAAKKNNNKKIFDEFWGIKVQKKSAPTEVSSVDETVANILGGNAEGITTPTAAKNKKIVLSKDEYEIDGKFYSVYETSRDGYLVYQYKKKKDGTPTNRPAPVVIGKLDNKPEPDENFLSKIVIFDEEEYETELRALNMKYSPIRETSSEKKDEVIPGLVLPTVKKNEDNYEGDTQTENETDGDIDDLLNSI